MCANLATYNYNVITCTCKHQQAKQTHVTIGNLIFNVITNKPTKFYCKHEIKDKAQKTSFYIKMVMTYKYSKKNSETCCTL